MYIEKNGTILNVSKGAYFALFEKDGWKVVKDINKTKKHAKNSDFMSPQPHEKEKSEPKNAFEEMPFGNMFQSNDETSIEDDEDYEVVLEDMTNKELKAYAMEKGIDLDGATKKEDIIGVIRAELED